MRLQDCTHRSWMVVVFTIIATCAIFWTGYVWGVTNVSMQIVPSGQKEVTLEVASAPELTTTTTTRSVYFGANDCRYSLPPYFFRSSSGLSCQRMPRVVIETWCTDNMMPLFVNEVYWKSCYAHAHGFDVLFTGAKSKVTGVKMTVEREGAGTDGGDNVKKWYSDENMWAWVPIVKDLLLSGKYDYVWHVGGDVLIQEINLQFPVWAWDRGHDITVMDQGYDEFGLNQNGLLFKASNWSVRFLDTLYTHRKNFNLQGDNGPYMETVLYYLGKQRKAETARGENTVGGYEDNCWPLLVQNKGSQLIIAEDVAKGTNVYREANKNYATCFFEHLDRLAGVFGFRDSDHIGFSETLKQESLPWANCWSLVRQNWKDWQYHCFALHWNGLQKTLETGRLAGKCPDATFDWAASPYFNITLQ